MLVEYQFPETSISGIGAKMENKKVVCKRMGRVPDHQDGTVAEDAEDGLQKTRLIVGVEVGGGFVEEQDGTASEKFARQR